MKVSRRVFLQYLTGAVSAVVFMGLSVSGLMLKKGAPETIRSRGASEIRVTNLKDLSDPGTVKFVTDSGPGILVRYQGTLRAFSASCTHMGCPVSGKEVGATGLLVCPCHGSIYDALTGNRVSGPATGPLPEFEVDIQGDAVYVRV